MKKIYIKNNLAFLFFTLTSLNIFGQQWQWAKAISMPFGSFLQGVQITSAPSGNFYVTGYKWDQNNGHPDGSCIIKFDNSGNEIWRKTLNDKIRILRVLPDNLGNILLAGDFRDTVNLNGIAYMSQNQTDGFLLSLNSAGATNWFKKISGPGEENAQDIHIDGNGNIFLTGQFSNNTTIDGNLLNTLGVGSTYVFKCNSLGNFISLFTANTLDSSGYNNGYRFQTDANGDLYILGNYNQVQIETSSLTDGNPYNAQYLAKLNANGQLVFLNNVISGTEKFKNFKITDGELYFTGDGGWTNGGWTKTEKYSTAGTKLWTKSKTGFYYEYSSNSLAENNQGVYTIGYEGNPNVPSWNTTYALMLSHFDTSGVENCTYINSVGRVEGSDITSVGNNEFLIVGHTPDAITFGNTTLAKTTGNIFITKFLEPGAPTAISNAAFLNSRETKIVPNPSSGQFMIQLSEPLKDANYSVYDLSGKCVLTLPLNNEGNQVIDLTGRAKGIYFLEINVGNERISKKLILD